MAGVAGVFRLERVTGPFWGGKDYNHVEEKGGGRVGMSAKDSKKKSRKSALGNLF